nr:Dihydrofolate reductase [uncultured bacterium]AIA12951.1 Dihydrofolate reductase [uncultured bacterium]
MKVFIIAAVTTDGFIGRDENQLSLDWTSNADKVLFMQLTKRAGVVVMGSRTFATMQRTLPERRLIVYTSQPEKITLEGVEKTSEDPHELIERLKNEGAKGVAISGGAAIYDMFMKADLVDEMYLTIEPVLFGSGVRLFRDSTLDHRLTLLESRHRADGSIVLHYRINK